MAQDLPKFEGDILDIGNDYFLVKKKVVYDWVEQMKNLEKSVQELSVKPMRKKTGVVSGKEGRNEVLNDEQKGQVLELRKRGYSLRQIAEVFRVSHETIRQVEKESKKEEAPKVKMYCWDCLDYKEFQADVRGGRERCLTCGTPAGEMEKPESTHYQKSQISTDPLERSNIFGTKPISEDFRKKD